MIAAVTGRSGSPPELSADIRIRRPPGFALEVPLRIRAGQTVAMLGPNGAGKSTTLQVLAGLLPLDDGRISLGDTVLDDPAAGRFLPPEQRNIGVIFQDYLLFDHLSVIENVAFGPRSRGIGRRQAQARAGRWLQALGLTDHAQQRPGRLSGGQAQRVAMARALATEPDLLLLDEPLAAVDVSTRNELRRVLSDHLAGFVGPRLLITHDPTDAFILGDHIYVLEHGRLSQSGTPAEIRRHPATAYVAALTGTNLLTGFNSRGTVLLDDSGFELRTADSGHGPVQAVIAPQAVSLHRERPGGSPRNTWRTTVEWTEPLGATTRIRLGPPLPMMVDITPAAASDLGLGPGSPIWAAVKATEVSVNPT